MNISEDYLKREGMKMTMNQIDKVWSLANEFVDSSTLVTINDREISNVARSIAGWKKDCDRPSWGFPKCIGRKTLRPFQKLFLYELIANSVNYCFWYGKHNIRPNASGSTKMYNLLDESFDHLKQMKESASFHPHDELQIIINTFIEGLSRARFPLIDHRVRHLNEILNRSDLLSVIEISVSREDYSVDEWLDYIITSFPGYSKDLFLKRAFLFIMSMYRRYGIFKKEISKVLVPADYQVPKVLRWLGCIEYSKWIAGMVDDNVLIPEGCQVECEIRAATIVVCRKIADLAGCTCEDVDTYLWNKRKECTDPFHLCITSNY